MLILFPGVGADERLFARQKEEWPDLIVPRWTPPAHRNESLRAYAHRFASSCAPSTTERLVIGGSSFGGMVACELARLWKPDVVVLLGSARSPADFPLPLRLLSPLAPLIPDVVIGSMRLSAPGASLVFGARTKRERSAFVDMLDACDNAFVAWAVRAIASWTPPDLSGVDVRSIHGSRDLVLWPRTHHTIVEGAGHLLPLTHGERVNAFLHDALASTPR